MNRKKYLVEIRVKDWIYLPEDHPRTVCYYEVEAWDEYYARSIGFIEFEAEVANPLAEPLRRKMAEHGITKSDCCAPDAVEID